MVSKIILFFSAIICSTMVVFGQVNCPPNLPLTLVGNTDYCVGSLGAELSIDEPYDGYEWLPTSEIGQNVLLTAGSYEVVVTHYTGCTDTLAFEVEQVSNPPQPTINVDGATQFCAGGSVVLSGPSGYPYYLWNSGSISNEITVFESGTFVVSVIDLIGCESSSNSVQIIVDPLPVAAFSPNLNLFDVAFNNLSLDAIDYEWNFGDGTTSTDFEPTHSYTSGGMQSMYLVAFNSCGSDTAFLDLASVGIDEEATITNLSVYPNPSNGSVFITLNSIDSENATFTLIDAVGRTVMSRFQPIKTGQNMMSLDFRNVSDGIYHLQLRTESTAKTIRLVIQANR